MANVIPTDNDYVVGDWLVRVDLNRLEKGDLTVQVEPRVFQALVFLVQNPRRVVSRETLLAEVWSDVVVNEEALTRAVSELRHILGDDPKSPAYIETIRKGGYRLIAEVSRGSVVPLETGEPVVDQYREQLGAGAIKIKWVLFCILFVIVPLLSWFAFHAEVREPAVLEARPFTSYSGEELRPAISPDGTRVAFSWMGGAHENFDIYVKQHNTETPLRLTNHQANESAPSWSPDGSTIAFVRRSRSGSEILTVPAIGGAERRIYGGRSLIDGIDWSPDGRLMVFSKRKEPAAPCELMLLDLNTGEPIRLTSPPNQFTGDIRPAFSPDGTTVAFVRGDRIGLNDIYVVSVSGGDVKRMTHGGSGIRGLDWIVDGEGIVFSSIVKGPFSLWRVDVDDKSLNRMPVNVEWISNPSVALNAGALVLEAGRFELNIWRISLDDPEIPRHFDQPLIGSTRIDTQARYSPDGRTIAFISGRSGLLEVWTCSSDGSNPVQLTDLGASLVGNPRWSPDGRNIAFYTPMNEHSAIFVVDVRSGNVRNVTNAEFNDRVTSWSRDGRWLYFGSDRSGCWQVWKMAVDGSTVAQVTFDGGITAAESWDGRTLFFVKPDVPGIWKMPPQGGDAQLVVEALALRNWDNWVVSEDKIIFTRSNIGGSAIGVYDFASSTSSTLVRVPSFPSRRSLAVSPDGMSILYSRIDKLESDLMIIEDLGE